MLDLVSSVMICSVSNDGCEHYVVTTVTNLLVGIYKRCEHDVFITVTIFFSTYY